MMLIKKYDNTYNCFPSLHVANSIIACYYLSKDKKRAFQVFNVIWLVKMLLRFGKSTGWILIFFLVPFASLVMLIYGMALKALSINTYFFGASLCSENQLAYFI